MTPPAGILTLALVFHAQASTRALARYRQAARHFRAAVLAAVGPHVVRRAREVLNRARARWTSHRREYQRLRALLVQRSGGEEVCP